jgi:nicotinate phosphoribosyltransferase
MDREIILTEFAKVINSDRYQYTESDVYLMEGLENQEAVFDMYFRKTEDGGFAVVCGVQEVLGLIKILNDTSEEEKRKYFSKIIDEEHLVDFLVKMKFTGQIYAMRDGEIAYPKEPVITIKAPLIQAKILETPILNIMNLQMAVATKASMVTRAAHPIGVSSFGTRRAHGFDSGVAGNKAAYIGGCSSHSNIMTEYKYGIPSVGTMAHSFVQTFGVGRDAEKRAFEAFIKHRKKRKLNSLILLIDTYNTLQIGIKNAIAAFKENGIDDSYDGAYGIRIDSGDLAYLSKKCRIELDNAGLKKAKIFLTSSLNEKLIRSIKEQGACADSFGVGDAIATSQSNPCFGGVYKIVQIDKTPVIKLSEDVIKISNPGFKEVYRIYDKTGIAYADLITLVNGDADKEKLINNETIKIIDEKYNFKSSILKSGEYKSRKLNIQYVKDGNLTEDYKVLLDVESSRNFYLKNLGNVSEERKRLENPHNYKVDLSRDLSKLKYSLIKKIRNQIIK